MGAHQEIVLIESPAADRRRHDTYFEKLKSQKFLILRKQKHQVTHTKESDDDSEYDGIWHIFVSKYLQFVAKVFNSLPPLRLPGPGQVPAPPPPRGAAKVLLGQLVTAGCVWPAFLPSAPR